MGTAVDEKDSKYQRELNMYANAYIL